MKDYKIAVVIPCYLVENTIEKVIRSIPSFVEWIICVNDCSPDKTVEKILSVDDPRVTLLSHVKNQGVGGAVLTGYSHALNVGARIIVKLDGDGQMDPKNIPMLIEPIVNNEADYAKGNRFLHSNELKRMPILRLIGNSGLTFLCKAASGYWNIFDPTNGFTAISKSALQELNPGRIASNYFFETSMLCELRRNESVVKDIPMPAIYNDESSSLKEIHQIPIFSFNLFKRFISRIFYQYFLYDFNAVTFYLIMGLLLNLFGIIWGIVKWAESARTGIASTTGTVLIAVLPIIIGIQLLIHANALDINDVPSRVRNRGRFPETRDTPMAQYIKNQIEKKSVIVEKEN